MITSPYSGAVGFVAVRNETINACFYIFVEWYHLCIFVLNKRDCYGKRLY